MNLPYMYVYIYILVLFLSCDVEDMCRGGGREKQRDRETRRERRYVPSLRFNLKLLRLILFRKVSTRDINKLFTQFFSSYILIFFNKLVFWKCTVKCCKNSASLFLEDKRYPTVMRRSIGINLKLPLSNPNLLLNNANLSCVAVQLLAKPQKYQWKGENWRFWSELH